MFENDSIQSFQKTAAQRSKVKGVTNQAKQTRDDFIMDTNNSSIVSKRSVEKLYWQGEPEYFRYFVSKFKRRSPLINRGYWLRMRAVESTVENFLRSPSDKHKLVINLGCGYDPLPWLFLGKRPEICDNATFVDVDYSPLMQKKVKVIATTPQLNEILPGLRYTGSKDGLMCRSSNYAAIGCDLRNLDYLSFILREQLEIDICKVAIIFVAEVSIAYMDYEGSQAVLQWASTYQDVQFCLLEQHLPDGSDHPFAQTMLKHFEKLRTPLNAIGTMSDMSRRFSAAGWPTSGIDIRSLWDFWSDSTAVSVEERRKLDLVEPFDEWEEFALFANHYFLLVATKPTMHQPPAELKRDPSQEASTGSIMCIPLAGVDLRRRFAALISSDKDEASFAMHAGLGPKERLTNAVTIAADTDAEPLTFPPLLSGLMCHTVTSFCQDCLLVGGRRSPAEASASCWYRENSQWREADSLPCGRYRHNAVAIQHTGGQFGVLILGGRSSEGTLLNTALLWQRDQGWMELNPLSTGLPSRFGAVALPDDESGTSGIIFGGIGEDRVVLRDFWRWRLDLVARQIHFEQLDDGALASLGVRARDLMPRFGAQLATWTTANGRRCRMLVGGIGTEMLTRATEIYNLDEHTTTPLVGSRPLLVGVSVHGDLCIGGGATCFSFGTYWNSAVRFELDTEPLMKGRWRQLHQNATKQPSSSLSDLCAPSQKHDLSSLQSLKVVSAADWKHNSIDRTPCIIRGSNVGACTEKWTPQYLKASIETDRQVSVHVTTMQKMDFRAKNFTYERHRFGDFIDRAAKGEPLYLRALSSESPSSEPTILAKDYPEIADDFQLPPELVEVDTRMHSSPLRISGRVNMWLHYDVMSNVLCQIRGQKRLILFPPEDVVRLGFEAGASSSSFDAFRDDTLTNAIQKGCRPYEALLEPGDILFIPSLWLHTAEPSNDMSVAVNVFFRDLDSGYAAGRDVYGNRDLAAYEKGRKEVDKIARSFAGLPSEVSRFYLGRLAAELSELAPPR